MRLGSAARSARLVRLACLATAALSVVLVGCPADDAASTCNDYVPPADFDALHPAVTFSGDVMTVFGGSCAFSTCHGAATGPANGLFLGRDAARVHAGIVGVKSGELPSMPFVTPGNPRESYLVRKIDGSQCALDAQCVGGSCQGSMPKNSDLLELAERDILRRWIAQGAKND